MLGSKEALMVLLVALASSSMAMSSFVRYPHADMNALRSAEEIPPDQFSSIAFQRPDQYKNKRGVLRMGKRAMMRFGKRAVFRLG